MNIALLGFGVVGRGVYDLVKNIPERESAFGNKNKAKPTTT